jgi:hypothetical protein
MPALPAPARRVRYAALRPSAQPPIAPASQLVGDNGRVEERYEGFTRDRRVKAPAPGYPDDTFADVRLYAPRLQADAVLADQFEAVWPQHLPVHARSREA